MKSWNELKWWKSEACAKTHEFLKWNQKHWTNLPAQSQVYRALHETSFAEVKCVVVGQDPYHTTGMATGLCFGVPSHVPRTQYPPTLSNIFKELVNDLHIPYPATGDLVGWARRGVLLLNSALTIGTDGTSHQELWRPFTEEVLRSVDEHHKSVVFVLWGKEAQRHLHAVLPSVQSKRNHVILSSHPSPLSARRGFFGSRPFSTINGFLKKDAIDWSL